MDAPKRYLPWFNRVALRFRRDRFRLFESLVAGLGDKPLRILDVGGRERFWLDMGFDLSKHHVTVVNLESDHYGAPHSGITTAVGDACDLRQYARGDFDIVFSNSVIEHVGRWPKQEQMASEVRRLSEIYFVQTPNFWFPLEPHTYFPCFQFMPLSVRTALIQRHAWGYFPRIPDRVEARKLAEETRLLTKAELRRLFPDADIEEERLVGLTKSLIALKRPAA